MGVSRNTLIHYDKIGILPPSGRDASNYRFYTDDDATTLERICLYRNLGLSLDTIAKVIHKNEPITSILDQRLRQIEEEISTLREQQSMIMELALKNGFPSKKKTASARKWKSLFMGCGFSEEDVIKWHEHFERKSPGDHQRFLEALGLPTRDIIMIRTFSGMKITTRNHREESMKFQTRKLK